MKKIYVFKTVAGGQFGAVAEGMDLLLNPDVRSLAAALRRKLEDMRESGEGNEVAWISFELAGNLLDIQGEAPHVLLTTCLFSSEQASFTSAYLEEACVS